MLVFFRAGSRTDELGAAGGDDCGAHLFHVGGRCLCLGEFAVVLEAGLEFGVDVCHGCGLVRVLVVRWDGSVGWWGMV